MTAQVQAQDKKRYACLLVKISALQRLDFEGEYYVANFKDLKLLVEKLKKCLIHEAKEICTGCQHCRYGFTTRQENCEGCFDPEKKTGDLRRFVEDLQTIQHGFELSVTRVSFEPNVSEEDAFLLKKTEKEIWSLDENPHFLDTWVIRVP